TGVNRTCWRILSAGDYREHWRTFPTRVGARALLDSWIWTRREGTPPDAHPQVSSIAPAQGRDRGRAGHRGVDDQNPRGAILMTLALRDRDAGGDLRARVRSDPPRRGPMTFQPYQATRDASIIAGK